MLCGSAFKNRVCSRCWTPWSTYLPNPLDVPDIEGHDVRDEEKIITRAANSEEPFSALAFKIADAPVLRALTYIRVYSGKAASGAQVINSTKGKKERIGKLFQMHANKEMPGGGDHHRPHLRGDRAEGHHHR